VENTKKVNLEHFLPPACEAVTQNYKVIWLSTTVLQPLCRTTCLSQHPQLRTGGFCQSKVLVPACPFRWQLMHFN